MVGSVQCPVCTLYLHAGMNLSDHLETHPKEQVIKALVQMTIVGNNNSLGGALAALSGAGGGGGTSSSAEGAASSSTTNKATTAAVAATPAADADVKPPMLVIPISPAPTPTPAPAAQAASMPPTPPTATAAASTLKSATQKQMSPLGSSSSSSNFNGNHNKMSNPPIKAVKCAPPSTEAPATNTSNNTPTISSAASVYAPTLSSDYRYGQAPHHHHQQQQQQQQHSFGRGASTSLVIPQAPQQQQTQQQQSLQQQSQQQQNFLSNQQSNHFVHHQQQQHQQANVKYSYGNTLPPPPPPLQLFAQQPSTSQSHQKPPPAYGAAISQIRSQHNQNKQQQQHQQHQQQQQQQHVVLQHNLNVASGSGKQSKVHTEMFLNLPPPQPTLSPLSSSSSTSSSSSSSNSSVWSCSGRLQDNLQQQLQLQQQPQHQQSLPGSSSYVTATTAASSSSASVTVSVAGSATTSIGRASNRQATNSPFGALLNAAAQVACSSPAAAAPSVLRYAESPVAHYLERDNGDFIVQETPKHIVECVEKEDGEFSVIERIYQSPPSVLHIHDDDDDEDDEAGHIWVNSDEEDLLKAPHHNVDDGDDEREDSRSKVPPKTTTKKPRKTKTGGRTYKRNTMKQKRQVSTVETTEDEEEFMSVASSDNEATTGQAVQPAIAIPRSASPAPLCTAPSTSSGAAAAAAASANVISSPSTSSTVKSKKNRVTVLSDVPLNMNEYLDLVGNIVASSRIGAARPFAAVAPIPLVKVEKEEPLDEYDTIGPDTPSLEERSSLEQASGSNGHGATSVIRMASTSSTTITTTITNEPVEDLTQPPPMKVEVEATMLLPQRFSAPAQQRGPKKLVIKPRATATVTTAAPTTTAKTPNKTENSAASNSCAESLSISKAPPDLVQIKNENGEPSTSSGSSILEKHLTTSYAAQQQQAAGSRKHTAANDDDARVLLEFANSKQLSPSTSNSRNPSKFSASFPSAGSVFASNSNTTPQKLVKPGEEYILPDDSNEVEVDEIVISSSSSFTSNSTHQQHRQQHQQHLQHQQQPQTGSNSVLATSHAGLQQAQSGNFNDFNFLYNQNTSTPTTSTFAAFGMQHQQQLPPHATSEATNAATRASSSSNSSALDHDSSMNATFRVGKPQSTLSGWYQSHPQSQSQAQPQPSTSTSSQNVEPSSSNFIAALAAVDCCNTTAVDSDASDAKYLDLDTCKREQLSNSSSHLPSASASASTTSSSFAAAATESSLVGGLGLNIRTDEKMPAKGEISEQESNCDIENSWSQSMYGDISQRYFRNQFADGYNQQVGDWRQDYYPGQDQSDQQQEQRQHKRFDFNAVGSNYAQSGELEASSTSQRSNQLLDTQPTTSASAASAASSSMALLAGPPVASTSRAAAEAAALALRRQTRRKIYKCPHCVAIFERLKDRNAHMIGEHNYVRQNRRLICTQTLPPANGATMLQQPQQQQLQQQQQQLMMQPGGSHDDDALIEDSKDGIVKIKQEHCQDKPDSTEQLLNQMEELPDIKDADLLGEAGRDADIKPATTVTDVKPNMTPLALTTPAAKLAAIYRMLIAYNESKLGQDQHNLSELEQKAMEKSIFLCYVCRTDFPSVKLYDAHLTEHPAECFTCGKKFYRWKNFSLHLKRHLGWKEFGCYVCDKKFVVRSALVEHMRMHTGQTPLKCKICGKKFKRYSNLTQHRKRHTKITVRKKEYVCHCGEVLPSKARFLWHKETHDLKPKCCPYCCDRFVHANSLRRHIRLAHSDKFDYAEPMECPMCKQIFAKTSIKAHMATHSTDPQYDCAICNKSFSTKWNLKIHSWVHANRTAKPFKCEYCPKAFVRELDFKNHMNAHKQIKPYTCEYCGCKFIRKYNYMRHRREHHGNKKFTCDQCDKSFHRHYYLIEHRRIHTGERPFHCTICGKSSTTKTNHNKHLKIHHSRDPFTVEV